MGSAVHQPGHVQRERVSEEGGDKESAFETFTPEIHWHGSRDQETEDGHQPQIISAKHKKKKNIVNKLSI